MYFPFRNLPDDIGANKEAIVAQWEQVKHTYHAWHVHRAHADPPLSTTLDDSPVETNPHCTMDMDEWQFLSQLHPTNNILFDELELLGHRDFNANHNWAHSISLHTCKRHPFTSYNSNAPPHNYAKPPSPPPSQLRIPFPPYPLANTWLSISFFSHFTSESSKPPLKMLMQGTIGTNKSFLIECLKNAFLSTSCNRSSPLLLLSPTGIAIFHINALTIHSGLHIPVSSMQPLEGKSLLNLEEQFQHVKYILIDEMSFIAPKILAQIDDHLREVFSTNRNTPFGGRSIILVGDLGQLRPIKDTPMYVGTSHGNALWRSFATIITLSTIFSQQGTNASEIAFQQLISTLRNATPTLVDWKLLMARTHSKLPLDEQQTFENVMHLSTINTSVALHNKPMLKK